MDLTTRNLGNLKDKIMFIYYFIQVVHVLCACEWIFFR